MPELKPCPFCGGEAKISKDAYFGDVYCWVECRVCKSRTSNIHQNIAYCAYDQAAELWNARVNEANDV